MPDNNRDPPEGRPALPWEDQCEILHDARIVHPHSGTGDPAHHHLRRMDRNRLGITLAITAGVFVAEVVGGFLSHSLALLSDAGHMLTDLSAQVLSLLALLFAVRPADSRRTYGYYRLEILAALANGIVLAVVAGVVMLQAYQRLSSPPVIRTGLMLVVAAVGLAANLAGAWLLAGSASLNVRGVYFHIISDALSSVAVLVGAAIMAASRGFYIIDPILGFVIGGVVILSSYRLVRDAVSVLLEAVPADIDLEKVRVDLLESGGIDDVHDLHVWTITSGLHAMSAHLVVGEGLPASGYDELLARTKALLLRRHRIAHSTLQIETTGYRHEEHIH
ncbi:MAG: cation diffusion facilitator family transporter [Pseudomonadota bacterium]